MEKLNFLGIGPKMAVVLLPWLAASIIISQLQKELFAYPLIDHQLIHIAGVIMMFFGLVFYFSTVRVLLKGLRETRLVTTGAFALCQNPLYSSLILFIIPSLSFILDSWLILTSSIIGYILFRIFINKEYNELEKFFGEEYLRYKHETPEFFPLPLKKIFSNPK